MAETVCPSCGADARSPAVNPTFPFCSKRCKLVDLGAWADGSYRIAAADEVDRESPAEPDGGDGPRS